MNQFLIAASITIIARPLANIDTSDGGNELSVVIIVQEKTRDMIRLPSSIMVVCLALFLIAAPHLIPAVPLDSHADNSHHLMWQSVEDDASTEMEDYVNDNPVIEVDDSGVPVCPPVVNHPQACYAKICRSDIDCLGGQTERVCCYNGCIRTCMIKVKPPPFFDYEESYSDSHRKSDVGMGESIRAGSAEVAEFQRPAIVLTLPGGCHLTQEQYDTYQKFQVSPNVRQCYCLAGDVFCQINPKAP